MLTILNLIPGNRTVNKVIGGQYTYCQSAIIGNYYLIAAEAQFKSQFKLSNQYFEFVGIEF